MPNLDSMASYDLNDPRSYLNPSLGADLIMKGGITSGLVYPLAASRLATRYRFASLGGASAGAIAAGLTAAAEYQRRHPRRRPDGSDSAGDGFAMLTTIPDVLGTSLATLFVPAPELRAGYDTLTALIEPDWSLPKRVRTSVMRLVASAPGLFWLVALGLLIPGLLLALALLDWQLDATAWAKALASLLVWLPGTLAIALLAVCGHFVRQLLRMLPGNGFGFCNGLGDPHRPQVEPALTEWLTDWLDKVAGLAPADGPLTLGHLYGDAASAAALKLGLDRGSPPSPIDQRTFAPEIDLQVMTTCLTLQRPYVFPFRTRVFMFCPRCWERYFPPRVLQHLVDHAETPAPVLQTVDEVRTPIDQRCRHHPETPVLHLPAWPAIPVVVGVRLSLSFPILLSAVPFQAIDFTRAEGKRGLVEVWFSDGGISSNFPIHFFDSPLPTRPTFGITLGDEHPDFPDDLVHRSRRNSSGILRRPAPINSLVDFLVAVFNTMHDWVDSMATPAPGFRDRIVEVRTRAGEGGINLKMKDSVIKDLARRGNEAAIQLEDFDFDAHRWIRYRTTTNALSEHLDRLVQAFPQARGVIAEHTGSYQFGSARARTADRVATEQLIETATTWQEAGYPACTGEVPDPRPQLRPMMRQ